MSSEDQVACSWELLILFYKCWLIKYCSLPKLCHTIILLFPSKLCSHWVNNCVVWACVYFILYLNSLTDLQNASWCVKDNQLIHQFNFPCGCLCPPTPVRIGCSLPVRYNFHLAASHTKNFLCLTNLIKPVSGFTCVSINCTGCL